MARNPIIYGLAGEIYVAESLEKGGTWRGVIDRLRKGRKIYLRKPDPTEKKCKSDFNALFALAMTGVYLCFGVLYAYRKLSCTTAGLA